MKCPWKHQLAYLLCHDPMVGQKCMHYYYYYYYYYPLTLIVVLTTLALSCERVIIITIHTLLRVTSNIHTI